jgi:small subunit ribosomal protein S6
LRNYQSILILKPDLDEAQVEQSIEKITSIISKFGGAILKLDNWGKKRLAYRVKKNKFGYYLNIYHTCEQGNVPALEREYQLYDLIIKYLVIRLEERDIERVMSKAAAEAAEKAESETKESVTAEKTEGAAKEGVVAGKAESEAKESAVAEKAEGEVKKDVATEKSV